MTDPVEPLPPHLAALLGTERATARVPDADRARLLAGVLSAVARDEVPVRRMMPRAAAMRAAVATLLLGGVAGVVVGRSFAPAVTRAPPVVVASPSVSAHDRAVREVASALRAPTAPDVATVAPVAVESLPSVTSVASSHPPALPRAPGDGLAAERTLLDRARSALARGDTASAGAALTEHAGSFPSGALAEEREYLAIRALIMEGKVEEARARAEAYRRRFGAGLFGSRIREELGD